MFPAHRSLPSVALLLFVLCGSGRADNLLLVSVDTLRADRLSAYGYDRNRTPNIDRWASEGVLFEQAFAEVPLTLPSHSTLLTGTYPFHHGVRDNAGYVLGEAQLTLAEVLRGKGYSTAAFIGAYVLEGRFGTSQGFETYDDDLPLSEDFVSAGSLYRSAPEVTGRFLSWLEENRRSPFFAWVHFYDPHAPYPKGYDHEVSVVDRSIGRIDRALRARDLLDSTHVIFVSDHGEALGEHGESAHGFFIYDSTLRVPFIVRPASGVAFRSDRIPDPVSLLDVMPTALQLLGVEVPDVVQGQSRLREVLGRPGRDSVLYAESILPGQFGWSTLRSIRFSGFKFIEAPEPEFYDLSADPAERHNLYPRNRARANRYRQRLDVLVGRFSSPATPAAVGVDPETARRLAALGYVALSAPRKAADEGGVDPKRRIAVYEEYQKVLGEIREGDPSGLAARIDGMRRRAPEAQGLHYLEALVRERLRDWRGAESSYRRALEENPHNNLARANLANALVRMNRSAEAEKEFSAVLARDPNDYRARHNRALLYRLKGEHDRAREELHRVLEQAPHYARAWLNLGIGLASDGEWKEAERTMRRALELEPREAAFHFHLARVLAGQGRRREALAALAEARRLDPELVERLRRGQ